MATRKRTKKQTLSEFRAWLGGVEELQPEGWAPDATQWQLIRDKIDNITEPKPGADTEMLHKLIERMGADNQIARGKSNPNLDGNPYGHPVVNNHASTHLPQPAPMPVGVPSGHVEITPAAAAYMPPAAAVDLTAAAKPNIDSSDGNYNSNFI